MNNDCGLIFESYMDNLSKTKKEIGANIMRMVKYGLPDESKIPELKDQLIKIFTAVKKAGGHVNPQQSEEAKQLINQLRNSGLPEDELRNLYRQAPAEIAEMPTKDFNTLKQHIYKGPLQIKKPSKELPYTHKYMHDLIKQDPREGQKEENAEDSNTSKVVDYFRRTFGPGYKEEMIKNKIDPYEFFVDYYAWMRNYDPKVLSNFAEIYNSKYPEHKVDTKKLLDMFEAIKDEPLKGYKAPGNVN